MAEQSWRSSRPGPRLMQRRAISKQQVSPPRRLGATSPMQGKGWRGRAPPSASERAPEEQMRLGLEAIEQAIAKDDAARRLRPPTKLVQ